MTTKSLAVVLIVAFLLLVVAVGFHGHGHQLLARWLPAIHGGH
ncbi:MAG TPA: hypothetical protein VGF24_00250 [Vicinamibacterales bacterium]|jgi:hypothetical protein